MLHPCKSSRPEPRATRYMTCCSVTSSLGMLPPWRRKILLTSAARGAAVPFAPGEGPGPRPSLDLHHVPLRRQKPAALAAPVPDELRCRRSTHEELPTSPSLLPVCGATSPSLASCCMLRALCCGEERTWGRLRLFIDRITAQSKASMGATVATAVEAHLINVSVGGHWKGGGIDAAGLRPAPPLHRQRVPPEGGVVWVQPAAHRLPQPQLLLEAHVGERLRGRLRCNHMKPLNCPALGESQHKQSLPDVRHVAKPLSFQVKPQNQGKRRGHRA